MLGEPEASIHTGLLWQGSRTQGDFLTCRWGPARGKPTPMRYLSLSFKTEAVSPCTIQTQGPLRASLFSAAGRGLTPVQMHCPMREGKPSAKLENHVLCLFSFFQFSVKRVMSACQQFLAILSHRRKLLSLWSTQHMASHVITRAQIQQVCTHRKAGMEPTLGAGLHNHLLWSSGMSAEQTLDH